MPEGESKGARHVDAEGAKPEPARLAVEQGPEHARRVEPGNAQPVDGPVGRHQRAGVAIGESGVLPRSAGTATATPRSPEPGSVASPTPVLSSRRGVRVAIMTSHFCGTVHETRSWRHRHRPGWMNIVRAGLRRVARPAARPAGLEISSHGGDDSSAAVGFALSDGHVTAHTGALRWLCDDRGAGPPRAHPGREPCAVVTGPDGVHARLPHHLGAPRRVVGVHGADRQLPRHQAQRPACLGAGPALVEVHGGDLRRRRRHRNRALLRVRAAVAEVHGSVG